MPNYSYKCDSCDIIHDVSQSIKDDALTKCLADSCNGNIKRIITGGGGFVLKGTGYYATDFKNKGKPAANKNTNTNSFSEKNAKPSSTPKTKK